MPKILSQALQCVLVTVLGAAILFAAKFAYESNAKLAVIDSKLDRGLSEIKECRALSDSHTVDIAILKTIVMAGQQ